MTNWHTVHDSRVERPPEIETGCSQTTVYERRNIKQETYHDEMSDTDITQWVYEQREYTRAEYAEMTSPAIQGVQQTLSGIELALAELTL